MEEIFYHKGQPRNIRTGLEETGKNLDDLKTAIENGDTPVIQNARGVSNGWGWGDLENLGFASKMSERVSRTTRDEWWVYTGPGPIKVFTLGGGMKEMRTGDETPHVEVDYS
jgi:hypothetical protein